MPVRVRFAPSPTGFLHIGGLRTALYNWLFARKSGGQFILRIEDTDQSRKVEGAVENIITALQWAGITIDEGPDMGGDQGPYYQSQRLELYAEHAKILLESGHAYRCFCTTGRLTELRERQRRMGVAPGYDKKCRSIDVAESARRAGQEAHVVRLAIPDEGRVVFKDIVRNKVAFEWRTVDDQVLMKGDGFPTYHMANVVDDHHMGITHVIRGEEWLPSMPKHLYLYQAFGWEPPTFAHLPLLLNKDRSKLSKRQGNVSVQDYEQEGFLPVALMNFIALMGWHPKDNQEVFTVEELVEVFELGRVQKGGAIFDTEKLKWLNGQHIRKMDFEDFKAAALPVLDPDWDVTDALLSAVQPKINRLTEIKDALAFFFEDPPIYDEAARAALTGPQTAGILSMLLNAMENETTISGEWFLAAVKDIGAQLGMKGRDLWHPIRGAISGRVVGPDIITIVEHFGYEQCRARLAAGIRFFQET